MTAGGLGVGSEFLEPFVLEKDTVMVVERLLAKPYSISTVEGRAHMAGGTIGEPAARYGRGKACSCSN